MKNSVYAIILMACFTSGFVVEGRLPENLAGTDIFANNLVVTLEKKQPAQKKKAVTAGEPLAGAAADDRLKIEPAAVTLELPLQALNLAYGAEFFVALGQAFYNANIVKTAESSGAQAAGGEEQAFKKTIHKFYADPAPNVKKKDPSEPDFFALSYEACNPMGILTRIIFSQVPGMESLQDFKVSVLCKSKKDEATTLAAWADALASAVIWLSTTDFDNAKRKKMAAFDFDNNPLVMAPTHFKGNLQEKPFSLPQLLTDASAWAHQAGMGRDLPLKLLVAGVYEMFGDSQEKIFSWYRQVIERLAAKIPQAGEALQTILPTMVNFPQPLSMKTIHPDALGRAELCYILMKKCSGNFVLLGQKSFTFPDERFPLTDCNEIMTMNIVVSFLQDDQGNDDLERIAKLSPRFKDFFLKYRKTAERSSDEAHREWALLVSKLPAVSYIREKNQCEIGWTVIGCLSLMNTIFDLKIDDFESWKTSILPENAEKNREFIERKSLLVEERLREKLQLSPDNKIFKIPSDCNDVAVKDVWRNMEIWASNFLLKIKFSVGGHGDIESVVSGVAAQKIADLTQDQEMQFPYLSGMFAAKNKAPLYSYQAEHLIPLFMSFENLTDDQKNHVFQRVSLPGKDSVKKTLSSIWGRLYEKKPQRYLHFMRLACSQGLFHDHARNAACALVHNERHERGAIEILELLLNYGQYTDALDVAQSFSRNAELSEFQESKRDSLWRTLFSKGYAISEALSLVEELRQGENFRNALELLNVLVSQDSHVPTDKVAEAEARVWQIVEKEQEFDQYDLMRFATFYTSLLGNKNAYRSEFGDRGLEIFKRNVDYTARNGEILFHENLLLLDELFKRGLGLSEAEAVISNQKISESDREDIAAAIRNAKWLGHFTKPIS